MNYILIFIVLIILSFIFYKSIFMAIIDSIALAWLCYSTPFLIDNDGYIQNYLLVNINSNLAQSMTSKIWVFLSRFGLYFKLDYLQFKTIIFIICMILIGIIVYRTVGANYGFIWGLYFIYPALVDIVQIRFFLAICIVLLGLTFLKNNTKLSYLIYFICLVTAIFIHNTTVVYAIFFITPFMKKYKKIILQIICILDVIFLLFRNNLLTFVERFVNDKQRGYFEGNLSFINVSLFIIIMIAVAILTYQIYRVGQEGNLNENDKSTLEFFSNLNIILLALIPLLVLAYNFYRLERISWIILYLALGILIKYKKDWVVSKIKVNVVAGSILLGIFGFLVMFLHYEPLIIETYNFF